MIKATNKKDAEEFANILKEILVKEYPEILIHTAKDNKLVGADHKDAQIVQKSNSTKSEDEDLEMNKIHPEDKDDKRFKVKVQWNSNPNRYKYGKSE